MAVLMASGQSYTRTVNLPAATLWTCCAWVRPSNADHFKMLFWLSDSGDSALQALAFSNTASINMYSGDGGTAIELLNPYVANTWYFVALRHKGTGGSDQTGFVRTANAVALTSASQVGSTLTPAKLYLGNDPFAEPFTGRVAAFKLWEATLTDDQLLIESRYERAVRRTNLSMETPMRSRTITHDVLDVSRMGRHWTRTGAPGYADGPPIIYPPPRRLRRLPSAAAPSPAVRLNQIRTQAVTRASFI